MKNFKFLRLFLDKTQEEIAKKLSLDKNTIISYENRKLTPSLKVLIDMSILFEFSLDYLILDNTCLYPKNLKLLKLAQKIDLFSLSQTRTNIEAVAESFLNKKNIAEIKQDLTKIPLTKSFNVNLKTIRNELKLTQSELSEKIEVTRSLLSKYEYNTYPPIEKIIKISNILNISIHALTTGETLLYDFQDRPFGKTMLLADQLLPLEEHKILIHLMETIIKNSS